MRGVGLKVLKNKPAEYVRLTQGGETIRVTDRDRVVAEIVPPREGPSPAVADAMLAELMLQTCEWLGSSCPRGRGGAPALFGEVARVDAPMLTAAESGTGKKRVAYAVQRASAQREQAPPRSACGRAAGIRGEAARKASRGNA
jgi:antitoxin (DNA-binding transcriptional repressor) of toxin-antitoxin stability system